LPFFDLSLSKEWTLEKQLSLTMQIKVPQLRESPPRKEISRARPQSVTSSNAQSLDRAVEMMQSSAHEGTPIFRVQDQAPTEANTIVMWLA
jgi:hypothetical protein